MHPVWNAYYKIVPVVYDEPCKVKKSAETDEPIFRIITYEESHKSKCNDESKGKEKSGEKKFQKSNICSLPYSRNWNPANNLFSESKVWPKKSKKSRSTACEWKFKCPRELDLYEQKLWIPTCKTVKPVIKECREAMDPTVCIFCLESLYQGGTICEICERMPILRRQSQEYGDDIAWRIGIRTRITVHKRCYDYYADRLARKNEKVEDEKGMKIEIGFDDDDGDENECDFYGEAKISEMEIVKEVPRKKFDFCLKKYNPPPIDPRAFLASTPLTRGTRKVQKAGHASASLGL